jgi:hypothetical protein
MDRLLGTRINFKNVSGEISFVMAVTGYKVTIIIMILEKNLEGLGIKY